MHVSWAARTDPGLRRSQNEDSHCARPDLGLFVVADGMGGHAGGEVASRLAVDAIQGVVEETTTLGPHDTWPIPFDNAIGREGTRLRAAFNLANRQIAERVAGSDALKGMATTAVAVLLADHHVALAHVGDSRAYLFRDGRLSRLTRDHSWVEEQMEAGMLSETAARGHPLRNIVTRALSGGNVDPEVARVDVQHGDRLLLCSDGLSVVLSDEEIRQVTAAEGEPQAVCDQLVHRANAQGGPDNITILLVDIDVG